MDIVDTFNHLIPTEHLDDALFLGSNLENEVCEDFSTNQNVLEDSLKNMLSDKDPMLGSASAQFCLPVLDSTDPNFQMPCSTVGLDDIMDEGVKETAHNTIDEDGLSSNRKLRDQMDGTTVKSPRKSPRLVTQEPVRSLRQSTLAKRSNASPSLTAKKSAVKSGSVQKGGVKQQDKGQTKCESVDIEEHSKEVEHNSNECSQKEETVEVSPPSSSTSERVKYCEESYKLEADTKHEIPNQKKIQDTSHVVKKLSNLPGTSSPTKETESGAQVLEREHHRVGGEVAVCTSLETDTVQNNSIIKDNEDGTSVNQFASEMSSKEQAEHKAEEELSKTKMDDESKGTGMTEENAGDIQETFAVHSGLVDGKFECSSDFHASGDVAHKTGLPEEDQQESFEDAGKAELKDDSSSMKVDQTDSEMVDAISAKSETNVLDCNTVEDIPAQVVHQETENIKMREHETVELQEDGCSSISPKCVKNVKTKHTKSKRNKNTAAQQKLSPLDQDLASKKQVMSPVHSQSTVNLKRHADEQGNLQNFHKPVKVRKKHADKEEKVQSCDSGVILKKKAHVLGKNIPWVQVPGQGRKLSAERIADKSSSHHVGSKETSHLVSGLIHPKQGQLPPHDQKLLQKHQLPKTDNFIKEEGGKKDSIGTPVDSLKEDEKEKLKLKKLEKSLQPRQRRSSKSISVDEPPLFIPDNISTVKKESSEHPYSNESKSPWAPSKQCGFCRKPHGNSCTSSNPALQHG